MFFSIYNQTKNSFYHNLFCITIDCSSQTIRQLADCSNLRILRFCAKLITNVCLVSWSQDLELPSRKYKSILVQKVPILLQKLSHAVYMFLFMLSTVLCVHVEMQYMLTTGQSV